MHVIEVDNNSVESAKTPKQMSYMRNIKNDVYDKNPSSTYTANAPSFQNYEDLEDALQQDFVIDRKNKKRRKLGSKR